MNELYEVTTSMLQIESIPLKETKSQRDPAILVICPTATDL
jgi:hypothetical protein